VTTPAGAGIDPESLRALIRDVLTDLLPAGTGQVPARSAVPARAPGGSGGQAQPGLAHSVRDQVDAAETVTLRTDADLDAFVRRLLRMFENPRHREALRTGRLRFRLAAGSAPGSPRPAHRVDKGAVTEAVVREAARAGARLVLGRRAVLTPLARDRARAAGVEIERER
jgi:hypothetical protein